MAKKTQTPYYLYDNTERRFIEVTGIITCGREEGDLMFPKDDLVSKRHCRFFLKNGFVYAEDLRSKNHTRVNSLQLTPGYPRRLQLNDVVEFGKRRLILTNQKDFPPANIQDVVGGDMFKAAERTDGSLTSRITGSIKSGTRVVMNRQQYRELLITEFSRARGWDLSTIAVLLSFPIVALAAWGFLLGQIAPLPDLPYSIWDLLLRFELTALAFSALFGLWHYMTVRRRFSAITRAFFVPVWLVLSTALLPLADAVTGVLSLPAANILVTRCLGPDKMLCDRDALTSMGYRSLSPALRDRIKAALEP